MCILTQLTDQQLDWADFILPPPRMRANDNTKQIATKSLFSQLLVKPVTKWVLTILTVPESRCWEKL